MTFPSKKRTKLCCQNIEMLSENGPTILFVNEGSVKQLIKLKERIKQMEWTLRTTRMIIKA